MASFSHMSMWPIGYFRGIARWLMINRRDVAARVAVLTAEISRIGEVRVTYKTTEGSDGSVKASSEPLAFDVTPNSSLERLLRAYIAGGGFPLDISMFLKPDTTVAVPNSEGDTVFVENQPGGGIVAPRSVSAISPADQQDMSGLEAHDGGFVDSPGYLPARMGGRIDRGAWDDDSVTRTMHEIRAWANQDIKERLQDLEWRIVKLCDLREQLEQERDEVLVQAFGGLLASLDWDEDRFLTDRRVPAMIDAMKTVVFDSSDGLVSGYNPNPDLNRLIFAVEDDPSEMMREH